ncbi:MAG: sigma 54-interacting transcriptional regulator [Acidobacteriia bacterium]|nr:sigma 54-interacting transcriptional regulator [Terriglobia bacterium]
MGIVSCCPSMMAVLQRAHKAAEVSDITVLIQGETGTGKQLLAQGIHTLDQKRSGFAFVTVHCSTISESLAESELFGHRRGAFSGAAADRKGLFQAAEHGTILLDDVNDLPFHLQPKLLDVIQRGIVRPVGSDREIGIDVRMIAACNRPLEPLVREGHFRSDLFHRLNVVKLCLPPLRERAADLDGILLVLAERHRRLYKPIRRIDPELVALIQSRTFPGNVRELENAVQRMLFLKSEGTSLGVADWMAQAGPENPAADSDPLAEAAGAVWQAIVQRGIPYAQAIQELEKRVLEAAIALGGDTRRAIAQQLHTSERTLYYKMRAHGLNTSPTTSTGTPSQS